ncbi:hypothetical protein REPUB_Repub07fG0023900 [Reevesia pubescens]
MDHMNVSSIIRYIDYDLYANSISPFQNSQLHDLDYAMPMGTIIVGDEKGQFVYRSVNDSRNISSILKHSPDAVALVFARDRDKARGVGDIEFHFAFSNGVSPIGPRLKAASVIDSESCTWLTATREGHQEILDGQHLLDDINNELEHSILDKLILSLLGTIRSKYIIVNASSEGDEEYLYVDGVGIRTGDYFQFYLPNPKTELSSCRNVSSTLRNLKLDWDIKRCISTRAVVDANDKKEAFGGFIISCCGRGESFFGQLYVDSSPFLDNFPEVPVLGIFCGGEIGRGYTILIATGGKEEGSAHCLLHVYSTVYLVMSYTQPAER